MTNSEYQTFLNGLGEEIQTAAIHYRLFIDLNEKVAEYQQELNQSTAFWGMTFTAHQITARAALHRAYDIAKEGLNLSRLMFNAPKHSKNIDAATIKADTQLVSIRDPLVKKLYWQRNNLFAHKNLKNILSGNQLQLKNPISRKEFETLPDRALKILNRYGDDFSGCTWSVQMMGGNDFEYVLQALRQSVEDYERKIQAEIDR
jgi:hypothetical protein